MRKIALILTLVLLATPALAVLGPECIRLSMRNNTNSANLAIDVTNPAANAILGYDAVSTLGRLDGGTGSLEAFLLGSGLSYDNPTKTISVTGVPQSSIIGLSAALAAKFDVPTGTGSQYLDGTGTPQNFTSGSRTFNYPSRALNTCYQVSASNDADFHYAVDVTTGLSLSGGAQGTVVLTSYTNNICTSGAQVLASKTAGQSGTLVIGLAVNQVMSVDLEGTVQAGKWMKITTVNTVGTPTYALRADQSEIILP